MQSQLHSDSTSRTASEWKVMDFLKLGVMTSLPSIYLFVYILLITFSLWNLYSYEFNITLQLLIVLMR